jgi:Rod binding domain-containing protein
MPASILPPASPPTAAMLAQPGVARAWRAAQDFEAMAFGQLLAPVFDTVDAAHGMFGGGDGESAWRPMLTQAIAKQMAAHGGIGFAVPVFRQILSMQETTRETSR